MFTAAGACKGSPCLSSGRMALDANTARVCAKLLIFVDPAEIMGVDPVSIH